MKLKVYLVFSALFMAALAWILLSGMGYAQGAILALGTVLVGLFWLAAGVVFFLVCRLLWRLGSGRKLNPRKRGLY